MEKFFDNNKFPRGDSFSEKFRWKGIWILLGIQGIFEQQAPLHIAFTLKDLFEYFSEIYTICNLAIVEYLNLYLNPYLT